MISNIEFSRRGTYDQEGDSTNLYYSTENIFIALGTGTIKGMLKLLEIYSELKKEHIFYERF